jgi:hypothetical protein
MTKKITALTPEQEKQLHIDREVYRAIGIRTGHDLECQIRGNAAILAARKEIGAEPPRVILWARSTAEALRWAWDLKRHSDPQLKDKEPTGEDLRGLWNQWCWGQTEMYWLGWYRFAISRVGVKVTEEQERRLAIREELARCCYGVITLNAVEIAIRHPVMIKFDDATPPRLHCEDGPALEFADGYKVYAVHGVRINPEPGHWSSERGAKMAAGTLTAQEIRDERNAEVRRVMTSRYDQVHGGGSYIRDAGAKVIHEDMDPLGFPRRLLRIEQEGDEPFMAIELTNSTPEPDGTRKLYTIRVDPNLRPLPVPGIRKEYGAPQEMTCLNAVASSFGMTGPEYQLEIET